MSYEDDTSIDNDAMPDGGIVIETDPISTMTCAHCGETLDVEGFKSFSKLNCQYCGKENTIPARLSHFLLLKPLGSGGMGTVFLAEDENLGRKVAIKVMKKSLGDDPQLFETFRNEAQSAARLNHPHVAQIYSFGREKGLPYLVMELVKGNNLEHMINPEVPLDPAFVLRVGMEIAEGLKAAEEVGLFHGDIKPDNILFDDNMQAKLVDFGIASMASQGQSSELWGTPYYIAPEKVQKKKNSARSDIYSLGATLYHAIAAQPPYDGADAIEVIKARFQNPPPPLEEFRPDIEPEVSRIISRMMYNDLFMRYPNYTSLINDIKEYLANIPDYRKLGVQSKKKTIKHSASINTESMAPTKSGGKKFVITKGSLSAASAKQVRLTPNEPIDDDFENNDSNISLETEEPQRKVNVAKILMISIISFVILLVGGLTTFVVYKIKQSNKAKAIAAQNIADLKVAEDNFVKMGDTMKASLDNMRKCDNEMTNIFQQVNSIYIDALNVRLSIPDLEPPPEPEPVVEAPQAEEAPATATADAAPATPKEIDMSTVDPEIAKLITLFEKPLPEPTAEQLDYARKKLEKDMGNSNPSPTHIKNMISSLVNEAKEAKRNLTAAAKAAPVVAPEPVAEPEPEPVPETEEQRNKRIIDEYAEKHIFTNARKIRALLRKCEKIAATEDPIFDMPPNNNNSKLVAIRLKQINSAINAKQANIDTIKQNISEAEKLLKEMKKGFIQFRKSTTSFVNERKKRLEEAEQNRIKEEKESQERIKAAKEKAAADEEISRVQSVLADKQSIIEKYDYNRVISEMERMQNELRTEPGKEELKWTIERFKRLASLKEFLINDLVKHHGLRRGYRKLDISGVRDDKKAIFISPGGKTVTIDSFALKDWTTLIFGLIKSRPNDRAIDFSEKGNQMFNAAIFFYVHGNGNPQADAEMHDIAKTAIKQITSLRLDAQRLIPALTKEEIDGFSSGEQEEVGNFLSY